MKISVCIPNYNYARFIGRTVDSVLNDRDPAIEVVVSDNASTDDSLSVLGGRDEPRLRVRQNRRNVGFAANIDCATQLATGEWVTVLSSDDLMRPGAVATYRRVIESLGESADNVVLCSALDVIDENDAITGRISVDRTSWANAELDRRLSDAAGASVYRMPAKDLLRNAVRCMRNPLPFASTMYRRSMLDVTGGYSANRMMNPDKWLHWRLLATVETAVFIDSPLFAYRVHGQNQMSLQRQQQALKFLVDEYVTTLEGGEILDGLGLPSDALVDAFVKHDVGRHGLATLARDGSAAARRVLRFGLAVYPGRATRCKEVLALRLLVLLGRLGSLIAAVGYQRTQTRWR